MDEADRIELVRQLFAWLTMQMEDALPLAIEGQGNISAERLVDLTGEISAVADGMKCAADMAAKLVKSE